MASPSQHLPDGAKRKKKKEAESKRLCDDICNKSIVEETMPGGRRCMQVVCRMAHQQAWGARCRLIRTH